MFFRKASTWFKLTDPLLEMKLKVWDAFIKSVTATILIITAVVGVSQYLSQREQLIEQNRREQEQRVKDFNSTIYRSRLELYSEATDVFAKFAYAPNLVEAEKAEQRFWELFDGKLSIVEDQVVKDQMVLCGDFLEKWETCKKAPPPDLFQDMAYDLTQACRESLAGVFPGMLNPLTSGKATHPPHITLQMIDNVCK